MELAPETHPWFLGCQFHPEYRSKPLAPHALFAGFVRAAYQNRQRDRAATSETDSTVAQPAHVSMNKADDVIADDNRTTTNITTTATTAAATATTKTANLFVANEAGGD